MNGQVLSCLLLRPRRNTVVSLLEGECSSPWAKALGVLMIDSLRCFLSLSSCPSASSDLPSQPAA